MTDQSASDHPFAERLLDFIRDEVALDGIEIEAGTDLLLTGAVDSLGVIRITQWMEDDAEITVDPADVTLENFQTVQRMVDYATNQATNQATTQAGNPGANA